MKTLAIIPARGGSKGIPRKNIHMVAGKPLISYMITAASKAVLLDRVIVSTDDYEIAEISKQYGAEVIMRPAEISGDTASSESVLVHALTILQKKENYEPDIFLLLQCTSPLTNPDEIDGVIATLQRDSTADSCFSAIPFYHFIWKNNYDDRNYAQGINHDGGLRKRRQDLDRQYLETGSVYAMRTKKFIEQQTRFCGKTIIYEIPDHSRCLEIDEPIDIYKAEGAIQYYQKQDNPIKIPDNISCIIFDFDGVFTDNSVYIDEHGYEMARCSREDGMGISLLKKEGIQILILSTEQNPIVKERCKKLGVECIHGVRDKAASLTTYLQKKGISSGVIYVGNDINDIECLKRADFSVVPADAHKAVLSYADLILKNKGGHGAVRELCDMLITWKKSHPIENEGYLLGQYCVCPWGCWEVISTGIKYIVKRICVNPGGVLSLQKHLYRNEIWVIVQGKALVQVDNNVIECVIGDTIHIKKNQLHRISNSNYDKLELIEIQIGDILDEKDIIRIEDIYSRK